MSKTIDEKVVSIQFDNKNFEKNVSTTMSTLDKLKEKCNLEKAVQGVQNLGSAASKVDMSGINNSVDTLRAKFSALDVVGVTALANIANSAVNAAKKMVKALTVDPISQGFSEYELKMNSVQTIMASSGADIATVNKYLEELNAYADQTIYSFSDMTANIGKFTNAGVDLESAVKAIQGISNEAAVSGANANEASRAMYNFAQALSQGAVKLIDWKSIENANMATVEFKNELISTALELGTLKKKGDMYVSTTKDLQGKTSDAFTSTKMFNESLSSQWMTTDVLVKTLGRYSDKTTEIGKKAFAAAQDVKTFSQLMDTLKEAVGSGWSQTFEIIFGDMEEAKKLWTGVNNVISPIVDAMSNFRNKMLGGALSSKWTDFTDKINKAGISTDKFQEKLTTVAKKHGIALDKMIEKEGSLKAVIDKGLISKDILLETLKSFVGASDKASKSTEDMSGKLKKFQKIVGEVWKGNYGNGEDRVKALTKAGYKYAEVQDLVNKCIGGRKLKLEDLSKTQLKAIGYTDKEADAIRKLAEEAEKSGTPLNELIESLAKPTGRELLFDSISNMVQPVITILKSLGAAWVDAFPPNGNFLYKIIEAFHGFTEHLVIGKEAAKDLTRTFKGLFALIDIISKVVGGTFGIGFKIAAKVISELWKALGLANIGILKVTASIGDAIVVVRNWIEEHSLVNNVIEKGVPIIINMCKAIAAAAKIVGNLVKAAWELPVVQNTLTKMGDAFEYVGKLISKYFGSSIKAIKDFVKDLSDLDDFDPSNIIFGFKNLFKTLKSNFKDLNFSEIGQNIVEGLSKGIKVGIDGIVTIAQTMADSLIESFKELLGIHSPSTVFQEFGENIIQGLLNGIQNGIGFVVEAIKKLGSMIADAFSGLDFADVFLIGTGLTTFFLGKGLIKGFQKLSDALTGPLDGVTGVLESFSGVLNSWSDSIKAKTLNTKSEALLNMAKAIGILVAAIIAMTLVDTGKLWGAIGALTVISALMAGLAFVMSKVPDIKSFGKLSIVLLSLAVSMAILASAVKKIGSLDFQSAVQGVAALGVIMGMMAGVALVFNKFSKGTIGKNIDKTAKMFTKMAIAIGILALVIKLVGTLSLSDIGKGALVIAGAAGMFAGISYIAKGSGANADKVGKMFAKMAIAIGMLVLVIKLINTMTLSEIATGAAVIAGAALMFKLLTETVKGSGANADKVGKLFFKFSVAIGVLALAMKLIATMSLSDIAKGGIVISGAGAMLMLLIKITKGSGKNIDKAGTLFLKFSVAVGVLAVAIRLISGMSLGDIVKGELIIAGVGGLFAALIAVSKFAGEHADKAGTMLMKMGVAVGIMAFSIRLIASLSMSEITKGFIVVSGLTALYAALIAVSQFAGEFADKAGVMLIKASAAMLILVGAIAIISLLDPKDVATGFVVISGIMAMFALLIKVTDGFKMDAMGKFIGTMATLTVVIGLLAGIIYLLSGLPVESTLGTATALSTLILALSASLKILSTVATVSPMALLAAGAMTLIVGLLGGILYLIQGLPVESTLANATALSMLLLALSGACAILAAVGMTGPAAFVGIGALITLIASVGTLMAAIGALTTYFPALEEFLNKGIGILKSIGEGLGSFVGSIVSGFLTEAVSGLPQIGTTLSQFMTNLKPFLDGVKGIDETTMNGVKALAETMLILTGANLLQSLTSWLTGGTSLADFGNQLAPFAKCIKAFGDEVAGVDSQAILNSANAAKALVQVANAVPSEGGLWDMIAGGKSLKTFGDALVPFGKSIVSYSEAVSSGINLEAINASAKGAKALVQVANSIPSDDGIWQMLSGKQSLADFGTKIVPFGKAIVQYSKAVSGDGIDLGAINTSVSAAKALVKVANALPSDGGFWQLLSGKKDLGSFGTKLTPFGKGIKSYSNEVKDINIGVINSSISAAKSLVKLVNSTADVDTSGVFKFKMAVDTLAKVNVAGIEKAFNKDVSGLSSVGNKIVSAISKGMTTNKGTLTRNMSSIMSSLIKTVNDKKTKFNEAGKTLASKLASGMDVNKKKVETSAKSLAKAAKSAISKYEDDFKTIGKNLAKGFANGISANTYLATAKSKAMANAAEKAARDALDINSPSKVFREIGSGVPEGFAQGITMFGSAIKKSIGTMSDTAINSTENAMSHVLYAINSDIDAQPTIRPVLDLSDVKAGAGSINSMFNMTPSVGVMANLGAINTSMNRRIQNGSNDDIVSAIKDLKSSIGKGSGDTYNVNGVTYDDGSNITDAVKALVRAAKVERRT